METVDKVEVGCHVEIELIDDRGQSETLAFDIVPEQAADFDAVILPGGFESPDRLRIRKEVLQFVREMDEAGKLVAAICHGPWILISAGVVKGRKVTGYMSIADDLKNAGAVYVEEDTVVEGNFISAPHYRNNGTFMKAVIDALED